MSARARRSALDDAIAADKVFGRRTVFLGLVFATLLSLLSWRLIHIQYIKHDYYLSTVQALHRDDEVLLSRRGQIYDRNNELLVANRIEYEVYVDRYHIEDEQVCVKALAHADGVSWSDIRRSYSADEIRQRYVERLGAVLSQPLGRPHWDIIREITQSEKDEIVLAQEVDEGDGARLKDLLIAERIYGVEFREDHQRSYLFGNQLTHVLGYIAETGNAGIEALMNSFLKGEDGYRVFETDRKGREIPAFRGASVQPKHGNHVRLTIDMGLQSIVEDVLDERGNDAEEIYVPSLGAEKVSILLLEPGTGHILAIANRPHFDVETRRGNWRNFAVCDQYEPGSTFKLLAIAAALDRGLVAPHHMIPIAGNGIYEEKGIVPVRDDHIYEELTVEGILIKSSNIGAYKLARQVGKKDFYELGVKFGFGRRPGTGLPGETGGQFFSPKHWTKSSLSRKAMGYEVAASALQMATAMSVVVNDGQLHRPRIVDAVFDERGKVVKPSEPSVGEPVISSSTALAMRRALKKVCEPGGTATRAVPEGYTVAGKTGTSQKVFGNKGYLKGRYVVSFMGCVPAENPALIGIVVVDDPRASRVKLYGGTIAAPIFRRIAERAMEYLKVEPDAPSTIESNAPSNTHELANSTHQTAAY